MKILRLYLSLYDITAAALSKTTKVRVKDLFQLDAKESNG